MGYIPKVVRLPVVATTDTWGFFEWVESSRTPKLWNAVAFDCMIARTPAELDSRHLLKINHFFAFRLRVLTLYLFLNGPFPASFSPFQYSWKWTNKCPILKFVNEWTRTADLWRRNRPLYQLSDNHRLELLFVNSLFDSFWPKNFRTDHLVTLLDVSFEPPMNEFAISNRKQCQFL